VKPISSICAWQATYSCPLRITCAPNGGCPDLDRHVTPVGVHDGLKGVVLDEGLLLGQVADHAGLRAVRLPRRRRRAATRIKNTPGPTVWVARCSSAILCPALAAPAIDEEPVSRSPYRSLSSSATPELQRTPLPLPRLPRQRPLIVSDASQSVWRALL